MSVKPKPLEKGSKVGIVAPARSISPDKLKIAVNILQSWGLEVVEGKHLFKSHNIFAGTDLERVEDLQDMLDNPAIEAVICARGGYGTNRIVDFLNFEKFLQKPKWLVGFSDITLLHCEIHNLGIESIHGIMPLLFPKQTEETIESLRKTLFGETFNIQVPYHKLNKLGKSEGVLIGGNLSLLASTIGTSSDIETSGKILFIEDIDEYLYHIDRMMIHLYRVGKLKNLAGLIVGHFSWVKDNMDTQFGKTAYEIIFELIEQYDYPVAFQFPVGHERHNMSMVCGREILLEVTQENTVLHC